MPCVGLGLLCQLVAQGRAGFCGLKLFVPLLCGSQVCKSRVTRVGGCARLSLGLSAVSGSCECPQEQLSNTRLKGPKICGGTDGIAVARSCVWSLLGQGAVTVSLLLSSTVHLLLLWGRKIGFCSCWELPAWPWRQNVVCWVEAWPGRW